MTRPQRSIVPDSEDRRAEGAPEGVIVVALGCLLTDEGAHSNNMNGLRWPQTGPSDLVPARVPVGGLMGGVWNLSMQARIEALQPADLPKG